MGPRRWREQHLDALLDTVEDMAVDADRLDRRSARDLVLAGWGERLRSHPPLGAWLGYALLDRRLAPAWHPWVLDDVRGGLFWLRSWFRRAVMLWTTYSLLWFGYRLAGVPGGFPWIFLAGPVLALPVAPLLQRLTRRRVLKRQGLTADGSWEAPVAWGRPWIPEITASHPVGAAAAAVAASATVVGAALLWGAAYPRATTYGPFGTITTDGNSPVGPTTVAVLAGVGAAIGVALAALAARAVRRREARTDRPALTAQQHRLRRLFVGAVVLAAAGYTWAGVVSLLPDLASAVAGALLVVAGLGLAGLALGARGRATPFTWSDLMVSRSRYVVPHRAPA